MDSWPQSREVEKPKSWDDRAQAACTEANRLLEASALVRGGATPTMLEVVLARLTLLVSEAHERGLRSRG